jgi:glycosyltransferase involved in cell wall biosynthesis
MPAPLVTIVIAAYVSRVEYLRYAIRSALDQSHENVEVLVSDDSPDDRLRSVVESFRDERLLYHYNSPPLGVARNHWQAFRVAKGDFVVILNHDDWIAPDMVESLVNLLAAEPLASLAFCDHWILDRNGVRLAKESDANSEKWGRTGLVPGLHRPFADLLVRQTIPLAMGALFRKASLPTTLPDHAGPAYDLWLTYLLARNGQGACYEPKRLSAWRQHEGNLTSESALPWRRGTADCWAAISADPDLRPVWPVAKRKAAESYIGCALNCWEMGERKLCIGFALRSLRTRPTLRATLACFLPLIPKGFGVMRRRSSP